MGEGGNRKKDGQGRIGRAKIIKTLRKNIKREGSEEKGKKQ